MATSSSISQNSGFSSGIRFSYSSTYNASSNTSTISITPQVYVGANWGELRMHAYGGGSGYGVYGNGNLLYSFSGDYGAGNTLRASSSSGSWTNFPPYSGSISTFTVQHNSSGSATFTLGIKGSIISMYTVQQGSAQRSSYDNTSGISVTITQSAPYAISYNANGGTGAPSSQSIYANVSYTLSSTRPTRTGYTFLGWSTSSTATTASYQPGQSVTPNGNLPLYAVWQKNSYGLSISQGVGTTVSVIKNGTPLVDGSTVFYGDVLSISIDVNTGYNIGIHTVNGNDWTSGNFTVTGAVSVISTATLIQYTLSITTSAVGVTPDINRTSSPIAGASTGTISNGAIIYYNDVLGINYTLGGAYQLLTATVNNVDISEETLPYVVTVTGNVVVSITAKLGAIVYIGNEAYQAFIGDGTNWNQYQAYIGNGSEFDQY